MTKKTIKYRKITLKKGNFYLWSGHIGKVFKWQKAICKISEIENDIIVIYDYYEKMVCKYTIDDLKLCNVKFYSIWHLLKIF